MCSPQRQTRQKVVGDNEERYLQKQRYRAAQHIQRAVVVLAVIGLQNHRALVAAKGFLDMGYAVVQPRLGQPFLLLKRVGSAVKRQHKQIHRQA